MSAIAVVAESGRNPDGSFFAGGWLEDARIHLERCAGCCDEILVSSLEL